jgi:hypothetical protein
MWGQDEFPVDRGGFDFESLSPEKPIELRQVNNPRVTGVIYSRTLVGVPDDEPLKGTSYFGQSVRSGTAEEVANARWHEEDLDAVREDKTVGLKAALKIWGPAAFLNAIVEVKYGDRDVVQEWVDEREKALIEENGGTLRDMYPSEHIHQTFNLMNGGKGAMYWGGVEARSLSAWKQLQEELLNYTLQTGTSHVHVDYVAPSGYKLGKSLSSLKYDGKLLWNPVTAAERRKWLETLPNWSWSMFDDSWFSFKAALEEHVKLHGTAHIPLNYVSPSGYNLGYACRNVRRKNLYLLFPETATERRLFLNSLPEWSWNYVDDTWFLFTAALEEHVALYGTARVNRRYTSPSGYNLGAMCCDIRRKHVFLNNKSTAEERRAFLDSLPGWYWSKATTSGTKRKAPEPAPNPPPKPRVVALYTSDDDE